MTTLIGFTGRAGCGKDTAASFLVKEYGFTPMAFASPLKKTAAALFGLPETYFHDRELKEKPLEDWDGMSPRHMLQLLGTEAVRNTFGANFWIKRWLSEYRGLPYGTDVVVTDVRFNNEAQAIRDLGGTVIHIVRPDNAQLDAPAAAHGSEAGVAASFQRDRLIMNDGTIEYLHAKLEQLFRLGGAL